MKPLFSNQKDRVKGTASAYRYLVAIVLSAAALFVVTYCSNKNVDVSQRPGIVVPVSLSYRPPQALNLEGRSDSGLNLVSTATALKIAVSSCTSGYTLAADTAINSGVVNLYKGDRSCLVKLTSFTLGSQAYSYTGTGSVPFSTWLAGDVATFVGASSSDIIKVFVITQVSSPVASSGDTVSYAFTDIQAGSTSTISQSAVSTAVPLSASGKEAPNYTVSQARYISTQANGSALMSFSLDCGSNVTGSASNYTCPNADGAGDIQTSAIDYVYVPDAYSACAVSPTALTVAQATAIFASPPSGTSVYTLSTIASATSGATSTSNCGTSSGVQACQIGVAGLDNNGQAITHGGFDTHWIPTGNSAIYPNGLKDILMIRRKDGSGNVASFLYFCVNIAAITQS